MTISTSNRYRRLIDSGIYDDFFPLRANACFHILDKSDSGSFSLRDFVENVKYISSYLSIYMDTTSDFTIINEFRYLDRNGSGNVNIDCFIAGLICKLSKLSNNDSILKSVIEELIPGIDCKSEDLISFLQSPSLSNLNDTSFYRLHFQSFTYLLLDYLHEYTHERPINHGNMKEILRKTIKRVIAELQSHFHLSRLEQLLAETTEPLSSREFADNYQALQKHTIKWNVNDLRISNDSYDFSHIEEKNDEDDNDNASLLDKTGSITYNDNGKPESIMNTTAVDQTGTFDYSTSPIDEIDMSGFDTTQLFLLNTAFKSLKSFFNLTLVKNDDSNEQVAKIENIAKELKKFNFHYDRGTGSNDNEELLAGPAAMMADLAATKEELKRMTLRAEVLEIGQLALKADTVDIDLQNENDDVNTYFAENNEKTIMFSDMLNEIELLRVCVAERGNHGMVLGSFLQTDYACIEHKTMKKTLKGMHDQIGLLHNQVTEQNNENRLHNHNIKLSEMKDQDMTEVYALKEQLQNERGEYVARSVELQVLREEVHHLKVSTEELKKYEVLCVELTRTIKKLEEEKREIIKSSSSGSSSTQADSSANLQLEEEAKKYNKLQSKYENVSTEHRRLEKENNRLAGLLKASDERTKHLLQDHMIIKTQLHEAQDDLAANKAFATKLLHDLDREGLLQVQNEQLSQKVLELQIEIEKLKSKTSEYNSETVSASKYMNELSAAEKKIDELENRVGELSIAVEKGNVATEQLEIFRDQLRVKSKESTEFALLLQSMDLKVKDKEQIKVANKELSRELAEYKVKIDKVPGLLAEIARLRGSSRASVKALSEQDKYLLECKQRIKELERSNSKLSNDLRLFKDADTKLKDVTKQLESLQLESLKLSESEI